MKTIILAAGKATRLLPLTKNIPQPLLKIGEKSILELQIDILKKAGIKDVLVITGYLSEQLEEFCNKNNIKTSFNPFYEVAGMAASLWTVREEIKNGFLFFYADILFDSNAIKNILRNKEDICLAVKKNGSRDEAEKIIEEKGIIKNISKEISGADSGEFIGIAKFSARGAKNFIKEFEIAAKENLEVSLINIIDRLIKKGKKVTVHDIKESRFIDIDFPENLKMAAKFFLKE